MHYLPLNHDNKANRVNKECDKLIAFISPTSAFCIQPQNSAVYIVHK